jgi:hypothetical protein
MSIHSIHSHSHVPTPVCLSDHSEQLLRMLLHPKSTLFQVSTALALGTLDIDLGSTGTAVVV